MIPGPGAAGAAIGSGPERLAHGRDGMAAGEHGRRWSAGAPNAEACAGGSTTIGYASAKRPVTAAAGRATLAERMLQLVDRPRRQDGAPSSRPAILLSCRSAAGQGQSNADDIGIIRMDLDERPGRVLREPPALAGPGHGCHWSRMRPVLRISSQSSLARRTALQVAYRSAAFCPVAATSRRQNCRHSDGRCRMTMPPRWGPHSRATGETRPPVATAGVNPRRAHRIRLRSQRSAGSSAR
jgi:hypothetical protein